MNIGNESSAIHSSSVNPAGYAQSFIVLLLGLVIAILGYYVFDEFGQDREALLKIIEWIKGPRGVWYEPGFTLLVKILSVFLSSNESILFCVRSLYALATLLIFYKVFSGVGVLFFFIVPNFYLSSFSAIQTCFSAALLLLTTLSSSRKKVVMITLVAFSVHWFAIFFLLSLITPKIFSKNLFACTISCAIVVSVFTVTSNILIPAIPSTGGSGDIANYFSGVNVTGLFSPAGLVAVVLIVGALLMRDNTEKFQPPHIGQFLLVVYIGMMLGVIFQLELAEILRMYNFVFPIVLAISLGLILDKVTNYQKKYAIALLTMILALNLLNTLAGININR